MTIEPIRTMNEKEKRDQQFREAEERERQVLSSLVANHPHMSNLVTTPLGAGTSNDGWITSATTSVLAEVKVRNKTTDAAIYIDTAKHFRLIQMAQATSTLPILFDLCMKSNKMLAVDLSRTGCTHTTITFYHRIFDRVMTSEVTVYPSTSIVDTFAFSGLTYLPSNTSNI